MQTSSDGTQSEIRGATTASYVPTVDDIGFFISVSCEPVRSDWARGPVVLSEQMGPLIPGNKLILFFLFICSCYHQLWQSMKALVFIKTLKCFMTSIYHSRTRQIPWVTTLFFFINDVAFQVLQCVILWNFLDQWQRGSTWALMLFIVEGQA